jgi:plastocyanin
VRPAASVGAFAAGLGLLFGAAVLAGATVPQIHDGADATGGGHGHEAAAAPHGGHAAAAPAGLAVAEDGYRLVPDATTLPAGDAVTWRFRIVGPDGHAVTGFDVEHERRMHLIVVRRDLTGYQHLHPTMDADGTWRVRLRLDGAGVHRAYADFSAGGHAHTLATDLLAPGAFAPRPLPAPAPVDRAGGYSAELAAGHVGAGATAELAYRLRRDGRPLDGVEPYLGADGHLVALREGDLAFLHVHPEESDDPGTIRFGATLPSAGRYRLFLQFKHDGGVRTVAHTLVVPR